MKNTTSIQTIIFVGFIMLFNYPTRADGPTPTFVNIPFSTPILSMEDPLGVNAITKTQQDIGSIETNLVELNEVVTNTIQTTIVDGKKKSQLTGELVVIGNIKAENTDATMMSTVNSILFAVNRDMEDIPIENGTIRFEADSIKFPGVDGVWFGGSTLATILSEAGQLDATNGVAFGDLKVYPMPSGTVGQTHTIITHESISIGDVEYKEDGITYNGETYEFSSDTNGVARLKDVHSATNDLYQTMTNEFVKLADLQEGITFDKISVTNLTIDGKKPSLEGHTHAISDIDGLDSYKNPATSAAALEAINGITNAQDIAAIQSALTNFLHHFVIQAQ